jgi:hypothetical protein
MDDQNIRNALQRTRNLAEPQEPAYERLLRRRDTRRRNARLASAVTAFVLVAAAVAGTVIAFGLHGSGKGHGPQQPAAGGTGPNLQAGPGQYYYWKTVRPMEGGNVVEELWWGEDGSGKYQVDSTNPNYGTLNGETWGPNDFPGVFPFETDLSELSSDPSTLLQQLQARTGATGASPEPEVTIGPALSGEESSLWRSITNLIEQGNATPSLRAAIYDVASGLPGVEARTGVEDPVGRPSVTLSVHLGSGYCSGDDTMYFDPGTHLLLASNGDLGCSPSVIVVAGGIVDSRSETVSPGQGLIPAPAHAVPEPHAASARSTAEATPSG